MLSKQLAYGLALTAALALSSTASAADDVIRLALPNSQSSDTRTLGATPDDLDVDTLDVARHYGYHGGYHGGYRGGYYGGYRGGYYGGYRGGYYGGYRGYYGGYRGYGYSSYGYSSYYPSYSYGYSYYPSYSYGYSYPAYSYGYSYGYGSYYRPRYYGGYGYGYRGGYYGGYRGYRRISDDEDDAEVYPICSRRVIVQQAPVYQAPPSYQAQPSYQVQPSYRVQPSQQTLPAPTPAPQQMPQADDEGTYPYDGGPKNPVPMPSYDDAKPTQVPYRQLQRGETLVSLKPKQAEEKKTSSAGKWNYPAYGEKPTRSK